MAKLLTQHDPWHLHAILGCIALLHFLTRITLALSLGDAFPQHGVTSMFVDPLLVLVHSCLPLASLLLPLPTKRNFNSPMIWPEFRLHSITFASRHVLATILWLYERGRSTRTPMGSLRFLDLCYGLLLIHGTMLAATCITDSLGDREVRTTNAMPYHHAIAKSEILRAKRLYTFAQFQATAFVLVGNPTLAFIPLTGIQSAPLLMTLVRKGKCSAAIYHCCYTWSLILPLMVLIRMGIAGTVNTVSINTVIATGSLAFWLRTSRNVPKHLVWVVSPFVVYYFCLPLFVSVQVSASSLFAPIAIIMSLGLENLLIPNIMFYPHSKASEPLVKKYGDSLVALLYLCAAVTYIAAINRDINAVHSSI